MCAALFAATGVRRLASLASGEGPAAVKVLRVNRVDSLTSGTASVAGACTGTGAGAGAAGADAPDVLLGMVADSGRSGVQS